MQLTAPWTKDLRPMTIGLFAFHLGKVILKKLPVGTEWDERHLSKASVEAPTTFESGLIVNELTWPYVAVKCISSSRDSPIDVSSYHELVGSVESGLSIALVSWN